MRLKPFFTYYGGKYRIAPRYPKPLHRQLIEPFCGSAGYALRHHEHDVRLYDVNPIVVAVWNYLITVSADEILALPEIFADVRHLKITQAAKWLLGFWCNKGSPSPGHKPSTWMLSPLRPNSQWGPAIKMRIASQLAHIRHWQCALANYTSLANETATWFVDPPYQGIVGRRYTYANVDYTSLASWCRERQGQTIVCEHAGATWLPFSPHCDAKTSRGVKQEVIWHNDAAGDVHETQSC